MSQNQYWFDHQEANEGWRTHNRSHPYENENGKNGEYRPERANSPKVVPHGDRSPIYTSKYKISASYNQCGDLFKPKPYFLLVSRPSLKKLLGVKECFSSSDLKLGIVIVMAMDGHVKCLLCTSLKV